MTEYRHWTLVLVDRDGHFFRKHSRTPVGYSALEIDAKLESEATALYAGLIVAVEDLHHEHPPVMIQGVEVTGIDHVP